MLASSKRISLEKGTNWNWSILIRTDRQEGRELSLRKKLEKVHPVCHIWSERILILRTAGEWC